MPDETIDGLLAATIREHHARIGRLATTELRSSVAAGAAVASGPIRFVRTSGEEDVMCLLVARPTWWDNPLEPESLRSLADKLGCSVWTVRYDPETLEVVGEPKRLEEA